MIGTAATCVAPAAVFGNSGDGQSRRLEGRRDHERSDRRRLPQRRLRAIPLVPRIIRSAGAFSPLRRRRRLFAVGSAPAATRPRATFRARLRPSAKNLRCDASRKFLRRGRRRRSRRNCARPRLRERHAVGHAGDGKCLDQRFAIGIGPDTTIMATDRFSGDGAAESPCTSSPLPDDLFAVRRFHDRIGGAVPHRDFGPRTRDGSRPPARDRRAHRRDAFVP